MPENIYQRVTNTVLEQLKTADGRSWVCPWHRGSGGLPTNAQTGRRYRGVNVLSLWCAARGAGFSDDRWATYRQWKAVGGQVRRGEKGALVIFYQGADVPGDRGAGDGKEGASELADRRFVLRSSVVFNASQVEGAPVVPQTEPGFAEPTPGFDDFAMTTGATIRSGGARACYDPALDAIEMPAREAFKSSEGYTATLAHELVHWTGAAHRLARDLSGRFGKRAYAAEELVAELGSAFVLASLGLAAAPHPNHAAYIASWLPLVQDDPRAIFVAASQASQAADWLSAEAARRAEGLSAT
jgi:antirestriction protein ArdC